MNQNRNGKGSGGFTLVETLLVTAILVILLGFSLVGVAYYRDYLKITELDNAAREIYMAAENRAVLLQNSGQLYTSATPLSGGAGGGGSHLILTLSGSGSSVEISTPLSSTGNTNELADLLPAGTIDPALWKGDFCVLYDKATGHATEVFYAEKTFGKTDADLEEFRKDRSYRVSLFRGGNTLVGHYSGGAAGTIGTKPLPTPGVEVLIDNGEELTLTVRYTLPEGLPAGVNVDRKPKVTLKYGGKEIDLWTSARKTGGPDITLPTTASAEYVWTLDSLEDSGGNSQQFKDLVPTAPGGDFTVTASLTLHVGKDGYIDSDYYAEGTDNSLFAKESTVDTAKIANLRHLQNLCAKESTYAYMSTDNTCSDFLSGVGPGITKAEQVTDIECRQYLGTDYNFSAINNPNLKSYDGKGYELRGLFSENHGGGLFNQTGEAGMTFQHIRLIAPEIRISHMGGVDPAGLVMMLTGANNTLDDVWAVNATIYGEGGTNPAAGGLVGIIGGQNRGVKVTINNCRVFWENEKNDDGTVKKPVSELLTEGGKIDYKITSKFAGGLVGICSSNFDHTYELHITNSFAATTIKSSHPSGGLNTGAGQGACIGGLVGGTGYHDTTEGTVKVTIENSYADCYFGEDWNGKPVYIGGLVGSHNSYSGSSGTQNKAFLTIENSYAAGFIVNPRDHVETAGLANDRKKNGQITASNCYSAVRVIKDGGTLEKPEEPLYPNAPSAAGLAYLSSKTEVTLNQFGYAFEYENNKPETHAYDLRHQLNSSVLKLTPPYIFPGLKTLPHYGDWAELEEEETPEAPPVGLVYYERYEDNSRGLEGFYEDVEFKTLKDESASLDGYALVVPEEGYDPSAPITYTVTYGSNSWAWKRDAGKWTNPLSAVVQESFTVEQNGRVYRVFPLPEEVITGAPANETSFYQELNIARSGVAASQTFYFNPHFAKTVRREQPAANPKTEKDCVSVRTPRHLYDLSEYSDTYARKGYWYVQEFDLDYLMYGWDYTKKPDKVENVGVYQQFPIGRSDASAFLGTYNGQGHTIQNVAYRTDWKNPTTEEKQRYFGLFGCAATSEETGPSTLMNIRYKTVGPTVENAGISGRDTYVGTLAGQAATVTNCTAEISGSLTVKAQGATLFSGGLVGCAEKINACSASLDQKLTVEGTGYAVNAGGLTGHSGQDLTDCTATVRDAVTVSGTGQDIYGGGLVGRVVDTNTTVSNCQATIGTLSVFGPGAYTYGGGLTGYAGTITGCTATITGNSLTVAGTGDVANAYGGGLTGGTGGASAAGGPNGITDCSVDAKNVALTVTTGGGTEAYGGGLVGRTWGTVSACGAAVKSLEVTGSGNLAYGGGLAGYANQVESCTKISVTKLTVTGAGAATSTYGGGLAGQPYWGVTGCEVDCGTLAVKVTGTGKDIYGGGLAGRVMGEGASVSNCQATIGTLEVSGPGTYTYGGGLVGNVDIITGCHAEAESITVTADGSESGAYGGGLAGEVHSEKSSTENCTAKTGTLTVERKGGTAGESEEYNAYAGGLVARARGHVSDCTAQIGDLSVIGDGGLVYGSGLAGSALSVQRCDATVTTEITVQGTGANTKTYGAGLIGQPGGAVVESTALVKSMTVTGTKATTAAGGLVAYTTSSLTSCAAGVGDLTVTGAGYDTYGAGLAGHASGGVERCEAGTDSLKVTGPGTPDTYTYAGGLVGSSEKGIISLSYAVGRISKESARVNHAGGLVGYSQGTITNCYAAVDVPRIKDANCGGLVGQLLNDQYELNPDGIDNSYWLRGTFRYRGEYYMMDGSGLTDSGNSITPTALTHDKMGMIGWVNICKPVDDLPASGSLEDTPWMADYRGKKFPYPATVNIPVKGIESWQVVHYGLWPIEAGTGPVGNIGDVAKSPVQAGNKGDTYYYYDRNIGLGDGMPVFNNQFKCVGWMKNCKYNEGTLVSWDLTTNKNDFGGSARRVSYAANPALPDAALLEPAALPAAQPAEPEPKSKDEDDPIPSEP